MYTFLDHYDNEYGAIATIEVTNAVNGEKSIKGEIYSNDNVLQNIDKGWRLRFQDEYFVITYAKPKDVGNKVQVSFDAVHQFFWDFSKMPANEQLADGSHTFQAYLEFIFKDTSYRYNLEQNAKAFEKQSFGYKSKLALFNDVISTAGVEFQVNGKVVRILEKTGTDLSTVVRKNFNMNDLKIEKNIDGFITYQKGFGAWNDKDDHSKGRLEVEYESPLAKEFGRLGGEPVVDERYTDSQSLLSVLKSNVENSYTISVQIDMEDLTRAGYRYDRPVAGDYIMAINETLGFQEKIRIVSYTSLYDAKGTLISHKVTCNDIGSVKKQSSSYTRLSKSVNESNQQIQDALIKANNALVTADGKNTSYFGTEFPEDVPKGTLTKGDIFYRTVGDRTLMYFWNGSDWEDNPVINDTEEFKRSIDQQFEDFNTSYDEAKALQDKQIADVLAKAGSAEDLANQAKTDAASAVQRSSQLKDEAVAEADRLVQAQSTALTERIQSVDVRVDDVANQVSSKVSQIDFDAVKNTVESNSTAITQNQSAIELKADKTVTDALATAVNQTKSELKITSDAVATKVSKTDFDATKQRLATAETTIRAQAGQIEQRLTSTQVDSAINAKGYQTKSDVDSNITGRGYITNSALKPYALSTTVQNLVQETADSFSRTISETRALIPTEVGSRNLIRGSAEMIIGSGRWQDGTFRKSGTGNIKTIDISNPPVTNVTKGIEVEIASAIQCGIAQDTLFLPKGTYTFTVWVKGPTGATGRIDTFNGSGSNSKVFTLTGGWDKVTVTNTSTADETKTVSYVYLQNSPGYPAKMHLTAPKLETGTIPTDWSPAPEDLATVTALHTVNDTVNSHTRTISEQGNSISQVIQTAQGLVNRVDNLSVGGRNYFLDSNTTLTSGYKDLEIHSDFMKNAKGKKFVVSVEVEGQNVVLANRGRFGISTSGLRAGTSSRNWLEVWETGTGNIPKKRIYQVFDYIDDWIEFSASLNIQTGGGAVVGYPKLEIGSMPTDWTPAPEDNDSAVQAVSTQVSQLAGSWAVKNLTSNGAVLNQINLLADGTNRIDGRLTHITGSTLIDNGVIKSAMIANAAIGTAQIGTIDAAQANIININVNNIKGRTLEGLILKGGIVESLNGSVTLDMNNANFAFNSNATINFNSENNAIVRKKEDVTGFLNFSDDSENGGVYAALGVTSSNTGIITAQKPDGGTFAGVRIYRPSNRIDMVQVVGDNIRLQHSTGGGSYYYLFKPTQLDKNFDINVVINMVLSMAQCFKHMKSNNFDFGLNSLKGAISGEIDDYLNALDTYKQNRIYRGKNIGR